MNHTEVAAAILHRDGLFLIAKRKTKTAHGGKWEFPGGKIEPGETPEICLERELREEFGVEAEIGAFFMENVAEHNGKQFRLRFYFATHRAGEFELRVHDEIKWVKKEELTDYDFVNPDVPARVRLAADA